MGNPNILSFYHNTAIRSTEFFIAVNSDQNVDVSTPFCLLICHIIGALFQNKSNPIIYLLVVLYPAWSLSTKQWVEKKTYLLVLANPTV